MLILDVGYITRVFPHSICFASRITHVFFKREGKGILRHCINHEFTSITTEHWKEINGHSGGSKKGKTKYNGCDGH